MTTPEKQRALDLLEQTRLAILDIPDQPVEPEWPDVTGDPARCEVVPAHHDAGDHAKALDLVPLDEVTHCFFADGADWNNPKAWVGGEIPGDGAFVRIAPGATCWLSGDIPVQIDRIRVDGSLLIESETHLSVETIVATPGSEFIIDTDQEVMIEIQDKGWIDVVRDPDLLSRGIITMGKIRWRGNERERYVGCQAAAMAGDNTITLDHPPKGWEVGDMVKIVGTRMGEFDSSSDDIFANRHVATEDERRMIIGISGNEITLSRLLDHDHPVSPSGHHGHVINFSSNITIVSAGVTPQTAGHVMHMAPVDIRNVAIEGMGRTNKQFRARTPDEWRNRDVEITPDTNVKGRYSLHLHRTGVTNELSYIVGCVIDGSPGWGIAQHDSAAIIAHNAVVDVFGGGIISEGGNEIGRWVGNIVAGMEGVNGKGDRLAPSIKVDSDILAFDTFRTGVCFGNQSRLIAMIDNVAASSPGGHGYAWLHRGNDGQIDLSTLNMPELAGYQDEIGINIPPIIQCENNEAYCVATLAEVIKSSPQQTQDLRSIMKGFVGWEIRKAWFIEYSNHYSDINSEYWATDKEPRECYDFGTEMADFVSQAVRSHGFTAPYRRHPNADFSDNKFINYRDAKTDLHFIESQYTNLRDRDQVLPHGTIDADKLTFTDDAGPFATHKADWDIKDLLTGIKRDWAGEIEHGRLPDVGNPDYWTAMYIKPDVIRMLGRQKGYYTDENGKKGVAVHWLFQDRVSGNIERVTTYRHHPRMDRYDDWTGDYLGVVTKDDMIRRVDSLPVKTVTDKESTLQIQMGAVASGEARHGMVQLRDGIISYTPDPGFAGDDYFEAFTENEKGQSIKWPIEITVN